MKRYSWKYMAGLTDGEGCIDMQGSVDKRDGTFYCRPRYRITLSGPAGEQMVPQFIANFGGSFDSKKRQFQNPNWMPAYTWILCGKNQLRKFLQNIVNHLVIKKEQAKFAIWWIDNMSGKHATENVRRLGSDELKAMKRDPQRLSEVAVRNLQSKGCGVWSKYSNACLGCGTTTKKHEARGYCDKCYNKFHWQELKLQNALVR